MKNLFPPFAKLAAVAACALTLGSCNRAEYAMLPKGGSYYGVNRAVAPVPAPAQPNATNVAPAAAEPVAETTVATAPAATVAPAAVVAPAAKSAVAAKEVAATPAVSQKAAPADEAAAATTAATVSTLLQATHKLTRVQKFAASRLLRKIEKAPGTAYAKKSSNTAATQRVSGNLRTGLILLLIGLLVGIFNGLIGTIIALIGVIFIVLWLLDSL